MIKISRSIKKIQKAWKNREKKYIQSKNKCNKHTKVINF